MDLQAATSSTKLQQTELAGACYCFSAPLDLLASVIIKYLALPNEMQDRGLDTFTKISYTFIELMQALS